MLAGAAVQERHAVSLAQHLSLKQSHVASAHKRTLHRLLPTAGGKLTFVWEIIRERTEGMPHPVVVFIRNAEHIICGSSHQQRAFEDTFGSGRHEASAESPQLKAPPAIIVAGCSLQDAGQQLTPDSR